MTGRILIGKDSAGDFGIKCSLPGFDVETADDTDPGKFSFNSNWNDLCKIHMQGLINTVPQSNYASNLVHGLSYMPFVEAKPYSSNTYYNDILDTFVNPSFTLTFNLMSVVNWSGGIQFFSVNSLQVFYVVYKLGWNSP